MTDTTLAATEYLEEMILPEEAPEEKIVPFEFDAEFQKKIAALMIRDSSFLQLTDGLIRPEYFENLGYATLVKVAINYYATYKKAPGDIVIMKSLMREALRSLMIPKDLAALAIPLIGNLYTTDVSDRDYVADECATFARHQAVARAIFESVGLVEKRDFDGVSSKMRKALDIGVVVSGGEYDYAAQMAARSQERIDKAAGIRPATGISTGFAVLDDYLYHKGWGRKELSVLMGAAKSGKSMAMISFGVNAIANGYKVLYVTLEVSHAIIAERMDANIAERAMSELGTHIHEVDAKVRAFTAKAAPFKIEEFPSGTMRPSDLGRLIDRYKAQGIMFDLVIVDYADLMMPERLTESTTENSKSVYVNLRGLAMRENFALLTATQTNREGSKKAVATMTDVSDDINKVRIADIVISINKSTEESALNQARLFFAASRNQRSGFTVKIEQLIDQAKFITRVIGED